jgi:hypothetical protein
VNAIAIGGTLIASKTSTIDRRAVAVLGRDIWDVNEFILGLKRPAGLSAWLVGSLGGFQVVPHVVGVLLA